MTCTGKDEALALYVEGDLAPAEARAIERHLAECVRCGAFLHDLRASQNGLKALAAVDGFDDQALSAVRSRVLSTLDERGRRSRAWQARPLRWLVAASLLAGAWALWNARMIEPRTNTKVVEVRPSPADEAGRAVVERSPARVAAPRVGTASTPSHHPRVSVHRKAEPAPAFGLSDEDADQLARAVVVVAGLERVPEAVPSVAELAPEPAILVRITTADPDVVIYWQLDSNGG